MSGVNPSSLLQSIERGKSFKQQHHGVIHPGNGGVSRSKSAFVEERGTGSLMTDLHGGGDDGFGGFGAGGALNEEGEDNFGAEAQAQDAELKKASAEGASKQHNIRSAQVAPIPDDRAAEERSPKKSSAEGEPAAADSDAGAAEKEPEVIAPSETQRQWRKLRIAAKTMSHLKSVEDDLRLYGVQHHQVEAETDDSDPRYYVYDAEKAKKWYIFLATSKVRRRWETLLIILLLYVAMVVPYRVCFDVDVDGGAAGFDLFVDVLFILDVFFNFVCAYSKRNGEIEVRFKYIAMHYARTWLVLDLVASIPVYRFFDDVDAGQINRLSKIARLPKLIRLVRLLRLLKLLRVVKLMRYMNEWENSNLGVNVGVQRMIKVSFGVFMVTHLIGCFWHFFAWYGYGGVHPESWVFRHGIQDEDALTKYLTSIYWAFSTLTTVGFGDISARTNQERIFSIVCMVVGVSWYAFVISSISSIMNMFDRRNAEVKRKQRLLLQFMHETKVPVPLRRRILSYFDYLSARETLDSDNKEMESVLSLLSTQLRTEVTLHVHRNLIPQVPFFNNKTPQFVAACVSLLKPLHFGPGDYISTRGQHADEMYFLIVGRAHVVMADGKPFRSIVNGSYFGEIGCMLSEVHRVSIVAATECEVYALAKTDLKDLMTEYPDVASEIRATASKRIEHLNRRRKSIEQGNKATDDRAQTLATSFPGMSFSNVNDADKGSRGSLSDGAPRNSTRDSLMSNVSSTNNLHDMPAVEEEGDALGPLAEDVDALRDQVEAMQEDLQGLRSENAELKESVAQLTTLVKQIHDKTVGGA